MRRIMYSQLVITEKKKKCLFISVVKYILLCILMQHFLKLTKIQGIQNKPVVVMLNDFTYMHAPLNY